MSCPATVVGGFLGAGKTTLLRRAIEAASGKRLAVLVNDFGDLNIDSEIVGAAVDGVVALSGGCICCSINNDLLAAIGMVLRHDPRPEHMLIEASGVSDIEGIAQTLFHPLLENRVTVDGLIAVIDAAGYAELSFADGERVLTQAAVADIAIINKCDLAMAAGLRTLRADLALAAPGARVVETVRAEVPLGLVLDLPGTGFSPGGRRCSAVDAHGFRSWTWRGRGRVALSLAAFEAAVARWPRSLFRAKGFIHCEGAPPALFQLVGRRSSLEAYERRGSTQSQIVFIGRCNDREVAAILDILDACLTRAAA